jgi:hypothetical protein
MKYGSPGQIDGFRVEPCLDSWSLSSFPLRYLAIARRIGYELYTPDYLPVKSNFTLFSGVS